MSLINCNCQLKINYQSSVYQQHWAHLITLSFLRPILNFRTQSFTSDPTVLDISSSAYGVIFILLTLKVEMS